MTLGVAWGHILKGKSAIFFLPCLWPCITWKAIIDLCLKYTHWMWTSKTLVCKFGMSVELRLCVCHIKQLKYKCHVIVWSCHYSIYAFAGFEMQGSLPVHSHHLFNWKWTEKLKGLNGEEALYSSWVAKKKPGLEVGFFFLIFFEGSLTSRHVVHLFTTHQPKCVAAAAEAVIFSLCCMTITSKFRRILMSVASAL